MKIHVRPGCGRLILQGFGQYRRSQQPTLETSAICDSLYSNVWNYGLCQMEIRAIPGCGISITHEDSVNIASLNNHPKNPLHSAPLCFPTDRGMVCDRQSLFRRSIWKIARARIVYKLQVTTTSQEAYGPICFPMDRSVVFSRQKFAQGQSVGYFSRVLCT